MKVVAIISLSPLEREEICDGMVSAVAADIMVGEGDAVLRHGVSSIHLTRRGNEYSLSWSSEGLCRVWFSGRRHALNENFLMPFLVSPFREAFRKGESEGKLEVTSSCPGWKWDSTADDHRFAVVVGQQKERIPLSPEELGEFEELNGDGVPIQ